MKSLSVRGVTKSFGGLSVLSGVELEVPEQSFTAILGPSGSGKTTLLRIIAGFERPDAGEVRIGSEVVDDAVHRFVPCEKRHLGYVPQEGALFPHLSVGRNVAFGLDRGEGRHRGNGHHPSEVHHHLVGHHHRDGHHHREGRRGDSRRTRVRELLELVGLAGLERRYPHQLSGGQQQRVAVARALASDPEIVLLDEPFSSLDAALRASVRADVREVLRLAGITAVLVTHDQDEALSMADQVAILRGGVIAQVNTPSTLYRLPHDAELAQFLGEANVLEGMQRGERVTTALGVLDVVPPDAEGPGGGRGRGSTGVAGPVSVMVRPEQLLLTDAQTGVTSVVRSYEYFGHDAVVRVQPDSGSLPELVVRMTAGKPLAPGARVGVSVHGGVVVWPSGGEEPQRVRGRPEDRRTTPS